MENFKVSKIEETWCEYKAPTCFIRPFVAYFRYIINLKDRKDSLGDKQVFMQV